MRTYKISFHKQSQNLKQPLVLSTLQINVLEILRSLSLLSLRIQHVVETQQQLSPQINTMDALDGEKDIYAFEYAR